MRSLKHTTIISFSRICNTILYPIWLIRNNLPIIAQILSGFFAIYFSLLSFEHKLLVWFPVDNIRFFLLLIFSSFSALILTVPAINEKKHGIEVKQQFDRYYIEYFSHELELKLDSMIDKLNKRFKLEEITASIMVPTGIEIFPMAKRLRIIASSDKLRALPSMALTLDWDTGVAGRIWKEGSSSRAIAISNDEKEFEKYKINPIKNRRDGSYGHEVGLCLPINYNNKSKRCLDFLGVLCVGSKRKEDYSLFTSDDFHKIIYGHIRNDLMHDVFIYCLSNSC